MYCGGQGVYLYYLSREFQRMGHDVEVFAGPPYPVLAEGVMLHRIESLNLYDLDNRCWAQTPSRLRDPFNLYEVVSNALGMFPELFTFGMRTYLELRRMCPQDRFDIIHDNQSLGYGLLMMKTLGKPVVATIHHPLLLDRDEELVQSEGLLKKLDRMASYPIFMQHIVSKRMDRVITDSNNSASEVRRLFGVPGERLRVIYPGVDTEVFKRVDGVGEGRKSLIMVGNTDDRKKGIVYLLRALRILNGEVDVKLTIVDRDASSSKYASGLIREYGLDGMVSFTGRIGVEELVRRYSSSTIAVTPSVYEGFGLPACEAMSCGVPVIATSAGGLPEVVVDGATGMLVPPADEHALAGAIRRLLDDEELQHRFGSSGRDWVEKNFRWDGTARRTIEVYEEALAG